MQANIYLLIVTIIFMGIACYIVFFRIGKK